MKLIIKIPFEGWQDLKLKTAPAQVLRLNVLTNGEIKHVREEPSLNYDKHCCLELRDLSGKVFKKAEVN